MKLITIFLLLVSTLCANTYAQKQQGEPTDWGALKQRMQKAATEKIGQPFAPVEEWKCTDGTYFDLNKTATPTIIFFGFDGCAPCHAAMPAFAGMANQGKYKGYNFVYITFDDSATINDECVK